MYTKPYDMSIHYLSMLGWLSARDCYLPHHSEIPKIGFVAYEGKDMVAMGFIRRVEGNYGQLDGLVSNPDMPPKLRSQAIDLVTQKIIEKAKSLKIKTLVAFTKDKNTLVRSFSHGFGQLPDTMIGIDLRQGTGAS